MQDSTLSLKYLSSESSVSDPCSAIPELVNRVLLIRALVNPDFRTQGLPSLS